MIVGEMKRRDSGLALAFALGAGACGRIGFDPGDAPSSDASIDDANRTDARSTDAPPNAITAMFSDSFVADTSLAEAPADQANNYGTTIELATELGSSVALVRFDVSSIPMSATVFSAQLELTTHSAAGSESSGTVVVYALREAWEEGTHDATAGVANYVEREPGTPWSGAGAQPPSRAEVTIGSFHPVAVATTYTTDLDRGVVEGWIREPGVNYGVVLHNDDNDRAQWASRESMSGRPRLIVVYTP